jgi:hypothetical protein
MTAAPQLWMPRWPRIVAPTWDELVRLTLGKQPRTSTGKRCRRPDGKRKRNQAGDTNCTCIVCPTDCTSCPTSYTFTVSGFIDYPASIFSGACCTQATIYNGVHALTPGIFPCTWSVATVSCGPGVLSCQDPPGQWLLSLDGPAKFAFTAPISGSCPPLGTWTWAAFNCDPGPTPQTPTGVLS